MGKIILLSDENILSLNEDLKLILHLLQIMKFFKLFAIFSIACAICKISNATKIDRGLFTI